MTIWQASGLVAALFAVTVVSVPMADSEPLRLPKDKPEDVPGEIVVKLRDMGPGKEFSPQTAAEVAKHFGATVMSSVPRLGIQRLRVPPEAVNTTLSKLRDDKRIERAEPNRYIRATTRVPNDPEWKSLWGLDKIGMPQAWDKTQKTNVVVAVVDTGIDYDHPDLKANVWKNSRRITVQDADGKPLRDHEHGVSFCKDRKPGDPIDLLGHGTQVAGIIGAEGNNKLDVAGVAWRIALMPIKVLCEFDGDVPTGTVADAIAGIDYAVEQGAGILHISWALVRPDGNLRATLEVAGQRGILVVAATNNESWDNDKQPVYPASFDLPNVIAVAATTDSDTLATFSSYGVKTVHVAAPGVGVLTTTIGGKLTKVEGVSFAAPYVSGCAALLMELTGPGKMRWAREVLLKTADSLSSLKGRVEGGRRLNCAKALVY